MGSLTRKTGMNVEKFGINVTKFGSILMCLKNQIVVVKCLKKTPHFGTINYHVYSELSHVHSGFSSTLQEKDTVHSRILVVMINTHVYFDHAKSVFCSGKNEKDNPMKLTRTQRACVRVFHRNRPRMRAVAHCRELLPSLRYLRAFFRSPTK